MTTPIPTSAEREQARAEAARISATRSVRLSAWAWGVLAACSVVSLAGARLVGTERSAALVVGLAVLVVGTPIAFVVLTVLAVRAAWRGLDSGHPVTTWANVLAVLDVLASIAQVVGLGLAILIVWWLAQCANDPTCQPFQF